jgi:hypothetical protein
MAKGQEYKRDKGGIPLDFGGVNTTVPPDRLPPNKYPYAQNVRRYIYGGTMPRARQDTATETLGAAVHSLRRLNDSTPLGPPSGFLLVGGSGTLLYGNAAVIDSGLSGNPLSLVPFRPNASVQPWMYAADSNKMRKVRSDGTSWADGIAEPQVMPTVAVGTAGLLNLASSFQGYLYRYCYRSSATGATSNPSPENLTQIYPAVQVVNLNATPSTDPQVDLIDWYRQGGALLSFTYIGTGPNTSATFVDNVPDLAVSANPLLQYDNFQPFPSIDTPKKGVVNITGTTVTWVSGDKFNIRWLPGTLITINGLVYTLANRPVSDTQLTVITPVVVGDIPAVPSVLLNGWGPNAHVGDYEGGVNQGYTWGLDGSTTNPYNAPGSAIDGNASSAANALKRGGHSYYGCIIAFSCATTTATSMTIRVDSEVPTIPNTTQKRSASIWYTTDAWATTHFAIYDVAQRSRQPDIISIGGGNPNNVQVMMFMDSHDDMAHNVFEVSLDVQGSVPVGGNGSGLAYQIAEPILAAQPLPYMWGPTDNVAFMFACGDPLRPGTLYWTKGNNPDSAPDTNQQDVTSPSEPLQNGCLVNGIGLVFSTERAWLIWPNFFNAVATVTGTAGSTWSLQGSILDRGLYIPRCLAVDGSANVFFRAKDGVFISPGGQGCKTISDDIANLFPQEGKVPVAITIGGYTFVPPDDTQPQLQRFACDKQYLYYDYMGTDANWHTLVYDIQSGGWVPDVYQYTATIHASEEGPNINGVLTGCIDGSVRPLTASGTETATCVLLPPCYTAGEERAQKKFGDVWVEAK